MKNSTRKMPLFLASAATGMLIMASCNSGKDYKDTSDSTKVTDSIVQTQVMSDSSATTRTDSSAPYKSAYTGIGKANPAKKHGKGKIVLQASDKAMEERYNKLAMEMDKLGIYSRAEVRPTFPGGQDALAKFIQDNIVYPDPALDNGVEGNVEVVFAVDENGKVYTPTTRGEKVGYGLDEAATDVVNRMPRWNPGQIKGKNVKSYYTLPISFKIN